MAISKQVDTSIGSHVGAPSPHNAVPPSPNNKSKSNRSHAAKTLPPISSKSANQASPPLLHPLKIPVGDGPYVRAKHVQIVERDPERAIALFWAALNAGDRVDSALKDMAVVMKQQNRGEEAIQAILSFRHLCSPLAQESLDNLLLDLYKKCGRIDDQVELLKHKLNLIHKGMAFNGKRTKTARSQGRKFQISIRQEATRLLGNLGWSYMQLCNYVAAEAVYRKALSIDADNHKLCNLGVCLLKQHKYEEARVVLEGVTPMSPDHGHLDSDSHAKSFERSRALLRELCAAQNQSHIYKELALSDTINKDIEQSLIIPKEFDLWTNWKLWEAPAPNFAADTVEISDNPAEISTTPALNHFKISCTNDPAMQELYKKPKGINGAYITDDSDFICNHADGILTGRILPMAKRHTGSFKREIGPSNTVPEQSKAKKNTHGNDKINGGTCNFAADKAMDACWVKNSLVSPAMSCQEPVARRLFLDGLMQEAHSDTTSIACVRAIGNVSDELMGGAREEFDAIDENFHLNLCTIDTSFNGGAREDVILDFTCVDRVIESIVPDAPSAIFKTGMSNGKENDANGNACALDNARYDKDEQFAQAHVRQVESMESLNEVHQHRLRIFQDMTHVASSFALEI